MAIFHTLAIASILFAANPCAAQGSPFACCFADGFMVYGFCQSSHAGVSSWSHVTRCWAQALLHFANTTVVGEYNLTMAEKYNIFVISMDKTARKIQAESSDLPLRFDADTIAPGATPELGYLPFELMVSLPIGDGPDDPCPTFELLDLSVAITLHGQRFRKPGRAYAGFTFGISGCGKQAQTISNLSFQSLGYGTLQLNFVTIRDSWDIITIDPPTDQDVKGPAGDALGFQESDVINCTFRYFGDVTGDLGNTFGLTQNGSRAIGSTFVVEDPTLHVPNYSYRNSGDGYQFAWYGSYPQEWGNTTVGFMHLDSTVIEYIRDVQLGSVNISKCKFSAWISKSNPIFSGDGARSTANPPSISLYDMETGGSGADIATRFDQVARQSHVARRGRLGSRDSAGLIGGVRKTYGCNASDTDFYYIWDASILKSAVSRSRFFWSSAGMSIPSAWTEPDPNPSFWLNLETYGTDTSYVRSVNDTLVCMRPAIEVNGSVIPAQNLTLENGSYTFGTRFFHMNDVACAGGSTTDLDQAEGTIGVFV